MDSEEQNNVEQTRKETDKKCPKCGAAMTFNPQSGKMYCPYCEHEEEVKAELNDDEQAQETEFDPTIESGQCQWGTKTKTIICKSCGSESIYDALQVSESCPYCGSIQVMEEKGKDTLSPSGVCPFKITKEEAEKKLREYIKGEWFVPKAFKEVRSKPPHGVYLPFWTFDSKVRSKYKARVGYEKTISKKNGDEVTKVDWNNVTGTYKKIIDDWLILASSRYNKNQDFKKIKFDTKNNVKYTPEFLAGFTAERYSVPIKEGWEKAKKEIKEKVTEEIKDKIKKEETPDRIENVTVECRYTDITYKYLLLPVWMSSCTYENTVYNFIINGQTGEVYGDTPTNWWCCGCIIAAIILIFIVPLFFGIPI